MSKRILATVAFLGLAGAPATARAQAADPNVVTLSQALRQAIAQNPALASAIADVGIADARVTAARGLDDFVVAAGVTWSRARGDNEPAQSTATLPYDAVDANASLTRPLSTGGSIALKLDAPWVRIGGALAPVPGTATLDAYQPSAQLAITQPLLRGRGYDVARAPVRQARAARDAAGLDLEGRATQLARDVGHAYWELAFAAGAVTLRGAALDAARAQLAAVNAQIDVGKLPPSASAEVLVSVAMREDETVDAEAALAQRAADLGRLLGLPRDRAVSSLRATERPPLEEPLARDVVARALEKNPDLLSLHVQTDATRIAVDVADNGLLPQLDVTASGGPAGIGTEPSPAFRSLARFSGYVVGAGLVFQEPIERRAARGARDVALGGVQKARFAEADLRLKIATDVANAATELDASRKRALLLARASSVAELDLEGETARFHANRSTSFDVLRRQQALADTRLRLLRAETDHAEAMIVIDALSDDLLARHGLAVRGPEVPR